MTCQLCNDSKVVHTTIGSYGMQIAPCPNCTNYVHDHYESELEAIADDKNRPRVAAK
ncbi:hypothetical protein [Lactiplantibacillus paraxiangfangensis]|uniref:hypothetical protein n=1 Tax=Lactiplantibacillus paraxiangfangensis TaxID=3076224 RepID=UPI0030C6A48C